MNSTHDRSPGQHPSQRSMILVIPVLAVILVSISTVAAVSTTRMLQPVSFGAAVLIAVATAVFAVPWQRGDRTQ